MRLNVRLQRALDQMAPLRALKECGDEFVRWGWRRSARKTLPPPPVKQLIVRSYAREHGLAILIETGTFLGDMVGAMLPHFQKIYSIELSTKLHQRALQRFKGAEEVELLQGDSGEVLGPLLDRMTGDALLWLDGHYSAGDTARAEKETPIEAELVTVLKRPERRHVVLIDDARLFVGANDYPTIEELRNLVLKLRPDYALTVADDIIRVVPK